MQKRFWLALLLATVLLMPVAAAEPVGYVSLTFDDGPSGSITARLLEALEQRQVRATFFLCGYRVDQYPETAQAIAAAGHELGIHGQNHRILSGLTPEAVHAELAQTAQRIEAVCGVQAKLLRPPGGMVDETVLAAARAADLPVILWSVDPEDWSCSDSACVADRIVQHAAPGSIILMHDMSKSSVDAAITVIDTLQNRGYSFVTVSELAALSQTGLKGGEQYFCFPP